MLVKILRTIINILSVFMIVVALFVLLSVVMTKPGQAPTVMGYSSFRVLSGSMEPTIRTDSMILVKTVAPSQIHEGDIISFYSSDPALAGAVNTHRVLSIERDSGVYIFTTKGDANIIPDEYPTSGNDVIGVVIFSSYFLGRLIRLLSNPLVFIPIILVPLLLLLVLNMVKTVKLAKAAAQEEEQQQIEAIKEELERRKQQRAAAQQEQSAQEPPESETQEQNNGAIQEKDN